MEYLEYDVEVNRRFKIILPAHLARDDEDEIYRHVMGCLKEHPIREKDIALLGCRAIIEEEREND